MKRMSALFLALAALAASSYALGAKEPTPAQTPEPYTLRVGALKGPTGIGMIRLFESPPALPRSGSLSLEAVASADAMAAKLISGELDAAVLPVNMAAKLYNAGLPYRLAAVVGNGMVKLVTGDASIRSLSDLKGRDVYVAGQGATPEYLMRTILKDAGIDADTGLRMVFSMPYPEIAASLVAGKIDLAVLPEPFATLALMGRPSLRVPFSLTALWAKASGLPDYPMSVLVVRSSVLADRPAAVNALLSAYADSIAFVQADPAAAGVLVEKHDMGLKAPVAAAAIPASAYVFLRAAEAKASVEGLLAVFLAAAPASIGGRMPDAAFYATVAP